MRYAKNHRHYLFLYLIFKTIVCPLTHAVIAFCLLRKVCIEYRVIILWNASPFLMSRLSCSLLFLLFRCRCNIIWISTTILIFTFTVGYSTSTETIIIHYCFQAPSDHSGHLQAQPEHASDTVSCLRQTEQLRTLRSEH